MDDVISKWQIKLEKHFKIKNKFLDTILFADDQVLLTSSEDDLQNALFKLNNICKEYSLNISTNKTKVLAFKGTETIRAKIILERKPIEQVNCFNYLGCHISYWKNEDIINKINKFSYIWEF